MEYHCYNFVKIAMEVSAGSSVTFQRTVCCIGLKIGARQLDPLSSSSSSAKHKKGTKRSSDLLFFSEKNLPSLPGYGGSAFKPI